MSRIASALLPALAVAAPLAAQDARDFQLPPATPSPDTRVQGPVDSDAPIPVRPRAIETARPSAAPTVAPTPSASSAPAITLPVPVQERGAAPAAASVRQPAPRSPAGAVSAPDTSAAVPTSTGPGANAAPSSFSVSPSPTAPSTSAPAASTAPSAALAPSPAPLPWLWIALGTLAVVAAGAFALARRRSKDRVAAPIIAPVVPAPPAPGEALAVAVEAVRMDRSVLNATVGYRVTIRNRTAQALNGVAVEADLVSASRERTAEQQIASPSQALTPRHAAERLAPGQSLRFEGQVRLPLAEASAIWQGRAALLVPLLRVRATAGSAAPVATTLVIGMRDGSAARPQPFRLDEPPRSYAPLAQRVLDALPAPA